MSRLLYRRVGSAIYQESSMGVISILVVVMMITAAIPANAQVSSGDINSLVSASDSRLEQLLEEAQRRGYSMSELETMARARGMSESQIATLRERVQAGSPAGSAGSGIGGDADRRYRETPESQTPSGSSSSVFGSSLFNSENLSFAPSLRIPTPRNYQLGPGDQLTVDIWGASEGFMELEISPEGTVRIPQVGPIYLSGLTIEVAEQRILDKLSQIYSTLNTGLEEAPQSHMRVTLGDIRSISVTVLGEASVPGNYTLPSLASAYNALHLAGGPNEIGSYRDIKVIRQDSVVASLDVYNYLTRGVAPGNIRLRDQDIIWIGPYDRRVTVSGLVKRKGKFELLQRENLERLLYFTGGFAEDAYSKRIKLIRQTESEYEIKDITYPDHSNFPLRNGDHLTVMKLVDRYENRVSLEGAVFRPGEYELYDSTTVYSLVERAEGLKEEAFLERGMIFRKRENMEPEVISFDLGKVMQDPERHDVPLQKYDRVKVSSIFDLHDAYYVEVSGAVINPGRIDYAEDMTLEEAIFQSRGFKESAAPFRVEVARRVKVTDSAYVPTEMSEHFQFRVNSDLGLQEEDTGFILQPFDRVYVRSSPGYLQQFEVGISGEVLFPGNYALKKQESRISDLIVQAGGLTPYAFPEGASLSRNPGSLARLERVNIDDSLNLAKAVPSKVGIDLREILKHPGTEEDLILREGDRLNIPKKLQTIQVSGEVLHPVSVRYRPEKPFRYYLKAAGGVTNDAKLKGSYIVYANGDADRTGSFLFFKNYPEVKPGASIFIPAKKEKRNLSSTERVAILSSIVSMAAVISNVIRR